MRVTVSLARFHPNFEGEHPGGGQRPPIPLPLPPTSQEDLRFNRYLEYIMPQRHSSLANIHAFCRIQTQTLWHSVQHH
ncbi:hypothetical protein TNCV_4908261 [Trichonephila clavipes]|uniref:Uncharacterized protein n=1 Tax=Trichonephila clavipes TaxID=2585209 RepID=A0A8X6RNL3_TRICX|nr:hypothetical protein TNCV_4908261 [Trichonephila clavipes]